MLKGGSRKAQLPNDAGPVKADLSWLTRLHVNSAAQQPCQHFGAHLPARTPAFPARRVIILRVPGPEIHQRSSREGVPDPLLCI